MDEQDFIASVVSEMSDEELEAFCDALQCDIDMKKEDKKNGK